MFWCCHTEGSFLAAVCFVAVIRSAMSVLDRTSRSCRDRMQGFHLVVGALCRALV